MEAFQQRVVDEKKELDEKIHRLAEFLGTTVFERLPRDEQYRLTVQHYLMVSYSAILGSRIKQF